jgi:hypothetical protein
MTSKGPKGNWAGPTKDGWFLWKGSGAKIDSIAVYPSVRQRRLPSSVHLLQNTPPALPKNLIPIYHDQFQYRMDFPCSWRAQAMVASKNVARKHWRARLEEVFITT